MRHGPYHTLANFCPVHTGPMARHDDLEGTGRLGMEDANRSRSWKGNESGNDEVGVGKQGRPKKP